MICFTAGGFQHLFFMSKNTIAPDIGPASSLLLFLPFLPLPLPPRALAADDGREEGSLIFLDSFASASMNVL
mgnify:CR=1 FL=1